ncbi:MAG: hypothetical protein EAZ27_08645 [Cytophagales bacterium]|nr:MAG: hypothetical protein EAZ27_08645 [Cytophagales bacterium]
MKIIAFLLVPFTIVFAQDKGTLVNICSSFFDEFAPSISADGRTLIYQSNKDGEYKLYESKLQSSNFWSVPLPINEVNKYGSKQDLVAGPSISYDGNTLYFCASYIDSYGDLDIYYSSRTANGWGKPINIGRTINSADYEGFPCISADGKRLYFTRILQTQQQGEDCFKIMYSERSEKGGVWGTPKELPSPINSGCDKAPRIMSDNKTLVFASIREGGKGNFDLYTSHMNDEGEWDEPKSMTFVNTSAKEQYATVDAAGENMIYYTGQNLYSIAIPMEFRQGKNITLQGYITDLKNGKPLEGNITIRDAATTQILSTLNASADGRYTAVLSAGKKYLLEYYKQGYNIKTQDYDFVDEKDYREIKADVALFNDINIKILPIDYELYFPVDAIITIKDNDTQEKLSIKSTKSVEDGAQNFNLNLNKKYSFEVKHPKYAIYNFELDLRQEVLYNSFEKVINMSPFTKRFTFNIGDLDTGEGLPVDMIITNLDMDEQIVVQSYMSRDGKHAITLREGNRYKVEVKNPHGYAYYNTSIDVDKTASSQDFKIKLLALKPGAKLLLKEIYFDFNSTELKEESFEELVRVNTMLKENKNIKVEVSAHTDNVGSEIFNKKLSEKRARYVADFMLQTEIETNRIKAVGYGKSFPIFPNDTEENRAKNRRLELKVIENF